MSLSEDVKCKYPRGIKVEVNCPEQSVAVQEWMISLGYRWRIDGDGASPHFVHYPFLYGCVDVTICYSDDDTEFFNQQEEVELFFDYDVRLIAKQRKEPLTVELNGEKMDPDEAITFINKLKQEG